MWMAENKAPRTWLALNDVPRSNRNYEAIANDYRQGAIAQVPETPPLNSGKWGTPGGGSGLTLEQAKARSQGLFRQSHEQNLAEQQAAVDAANAQAAELARQGYRKFPNK
jgi:hypothetical protein